MKKILGFCLILLNLAFSGNAQHILDFKPYDTQKAAIVVIENGKTLKAPFAGGIDAAQFASCDINLDGKKDIIVHDREGSKLSCFLNIGGPNEINYQYDIRYNNRFPVIGEWMLMMDYDGDGKEDLFCDKNGGIACYQNISTDSLGLKFKLIIDQIIFSTTQFTIAIGVPSNDIPSIADVDGDGDLDILRFGSATITPGEPIEWFKNLTVEKTGVAGIDTFVIWKRCWGRFIEDNNGCTILLNYAGTPCSTGNKVEAQLSLSEYQANLNLANKSNRHAGSTCLVFDFTGDGKNDILIGDAGCNQMYLAVNGSDNTNAIMNQVVTNFPSSLPINFATFPAAFLMDVNNDGLKDLIACPNTPNASENFQNVYLYLNRGNATVPYFVFDNARFLAEEQIDIGEGACPSFVDYNQDGLIDIMIGSTGYYQSNGSYKSGLTLYQNIGTKTIPKYELQTRDYAGFSSIGIQKFSPVFFDADADGDIDMITGSSDGNFYYFNNSAGVGQPFNLNFIPNTFSNLDIGNNSSPTAYDLDKDGIQDLISGENFYNINFLKGQSNSQPAYVLATDSLYKINLGNLFLYPSGRASVAIKKLFTNDRDRFIFSDANGYVYCFDSLYTNPNQSNVKITNLVDLMQGVYSYANGGFKIDLADIDDDGKAELITGTPRGGVAIYWNASLAPVGINQIRNNTLISYPNPCESIFYIDIPLNEKLNSLNVTDLMGTKKDIPFSLLNNQIKLEISSLVPGFYVVAIQTNQQHYSSKFIKK